MQPEVDRPRIEAVQLSTFSGLYPSSQCVEHLPEPTSRIVLAERYGLRQVAITGITPESEPSPRRVADVIRTVRRTHATTVFFERLLSPRLAKTVARDAGARTAVLDPIEAEEHGQTYLTLMRRNLTELRRALGCR